jgi:hypothetical protein
MEKINVPIYYEACNKSMMPSYPFFISKLKQIQNLSKKIYPKHIETYDVSLQSIIITNDKCNNCNIKKFYKLGQIVWANNLKHKIETHQSYPSEYFIKIILNTCVINNIIVNPPIEINHDQISTFTYIPLHYNKLLIIDALMHQGSYPRYLLPKNKANNDDKYIYSEHSGVISVKNRVIDNIIVSAETERVDINDDTIYLPINTEILGKYEYLFHTHPNALKYAGRINDGVIYEFPSANDVFNFVKYHNEGKAQASIVITPEGSYVIRPIYYQKKYNIDPKIFYFLRKFILKLEKMAIRKIGKAITKISDPDIFHQLVGSNFSYIDMYNKFIEPTNLFIEFYPREKKNDEWCLRQINLPYIDQD